jgi:hypothetical protein
VTAMSTDASLLAHGLHYSVLGAGLLGLFVLLGPSLSTHRRYDASPRRGGHDEHEQRVLALRRQFDPHPPVATAVPAAPVLLGDARVEQLLLPLAVVSSAAAAGVHAAVGPAHFREQTLFGLFFAGSALLQILWSVAVASRPTRPALVAGLAGNLAILALWLITRTAGLPWGLLPRPESVGPWDAASGFWELAVVVSCALALRSGDRRPRFLPWARWSFAARGWSLASAAALVLLSVNGGGS